jgi:hypothetical protein
MARTTPAQKPRGWAKITLIGNKPPRRLPPYGWGLATALLLAMFPRYFGHSVVTIKPRIVLEFRRPPQIPARPGHLAY